MTLTDVLITVGVLLAIVIFAWSAIRKQSLQDTIREIKDMFKAIGGK